jgi:putative PIN family toxin of toxin-antitoxin system
MTTAPPGSIFDCNVYFQAFFTPDGPAYNCFDLVAKRRAALVTSIEILREVRDVLERLDTRQRFHASPEEIDSFLRRVRYGADVWRNVPSTMEFERDPDDSSYPNLAICSKAQYLVTRDNALLSLATAHTPRCPATSPVDA